MLNNSKEVQLPILEEEASFPSADTPSALLLSVSASGGALLPDVTAKPFENSMFFHVQKTQFF